MSLICLCFALVLFIIAALREPNRWNLTAGGLAFYMLSLLLNGAHWPR